MGKDFPRDRVDRGFCIDKSGTLYRDDGFDLTVLEDGTRILDLFMVDTDALISVDSRMYKVALDKGETRYLPDAPAEHMLPHGFRVRHGFFHEQGREAIQVSLRLGANGTCIAPPRITRVLFRPTVCISHQQALVIFRDPRNLFHKKLTQARSLAMQLFNRRCALSPTPGLVQLLDHDVQEVVRGERVKYPHQSERGWSRLIVRELSYLLSESLGDYMQTHDQPAIFLGQHVPEKEQLAQIAATCQGVLSGRQVYGGVQQRIVRLLPFQRFRTQHGVLYSRGVPQLAIGSQLRRAADMVNARLLMAVAEGREMPYEWQELSHIAEHLNNQHRAYRRLKMQGRAQKRPRGRGAQAR